MQTLDDLDILVDSLQHAGVEVSLTVEGARRRLEPGVELTAYRVVQESLTNVLKHSGASRAQVTVTYGDDGVDIEVCDTGRAGRAGPAVGAVPGGHGLLGLRERVRLVGGTLEYGAVEGAGFRVAAQLPSPAPAAS